MFATVAPIALFSILPAPLWSGTFDDLPVIEVTGDGYIFADPAEGVLEPGLKAVTLEPNADYDNTQNPSGVGNCLMANNPDILCTAQQGAGKRIKTRLTGKDGMDIRLSTQPSEGITEYFLYGKTSNLTGARITGFTIEFGTGTGADFVAIDPSDPATAALFDPDFNPYANLPDGLFGDGGQEGTGIGFFDASGADMTVETVNPALNLSALSNATHTTYFGDALLDNSMVPDAYFWDVTGTEIESDEPVLVAWHNLSEGAWLYGNLGLEQGDLDLRLAALADSLGVSVEALAYTPGGALPEEVVALMEGNALFEVDIIEDLRNLNLNFMIDLGDVAGNEVTLRLTPIFADIVQETQSDYQFVTAAQLDAAANVPYFDLGNAEEYQSAIAAILALDAPEQAEALERTGFSFLSAFSGLGFEMGRAQVLAFDGLGAESGSDGAVLSSKGLPNGWMLGADTYGFVSLQGQAASYESTANGIGYDVDSFGVNGGVERMIDPTLSVGVMIGAASATSDAYNDRGEIDAKGYSLALFGRKAFGEGGTVQAILGYQDLSFDTARNVMDLTAKGETDGSQIFAAIKADYMFERGALRWGPMAGIEYYHQKVDGFTETGADAWNLAIGDQSGDVTVASLGVKGDYRLNASDSRLTASLSYNSASGDDQLIRSGFVGLPGGVVPVDGFDQDWVDVAVGFSSSLPVSNGKGARIQGGYVGSFGDDYENHAVQVALKMAF
ncbi:choice-of-anchor F family protein [Sinirhodobacter sp. WL0062]|uniref:Choice-of-anchor F family protein n=1 Tax=Rhodobacter flavimaris TaxID=2907145 RepID=A0ABS8Z0F6_9RHOB|nr:choice-of-anchor F family protein [Sinirhodobacter sp. WL0062]MCE5974298.1 choice-of-anchor F family protein [Sinirhodobacter sp. WL0062]